MRILEQTNDILTIQNPGREFWLSNIFMLFGGTPVLVIVALIMSNTWWSFPYFFIAAGGFYLALKQIWASDVVKVCSFNKAVSRVTVKCHGLQAKVKDFPLQDVQTIEVRKSSSYAFGVVLENYQLYLISRNFGDILLSEENGIKAIIEASANRVQEFLSLRDRSR
jgi:hypothetical protein